MEDLYLVQLNQLLNDWNATCRLQCDSEQYEAQTEWVSHGSETLQWEPLPRDEGAQWVFHGPESLRWEPLPRDGGAPWVSHGPARLLDWLYVGDVSDAASHGLIKELGVTHVINCAASAGTPAGTPVGAPAGRAAAHLSARPHGHRSANRFSLSRLSSLPYGGDTGVRVFHQLAAHDQPDYDLLGRHFEEVRRVIDTARGEGGRTLLYCQQGVNRSVALGVAYLVDGNHCRELAGAVERVARARGRILTNPGFRKQLVGFAWERNRLGNFSQHLLD